jgi:hypothetical protein
MKLMAKGVGKKMAKSAVAHKLKVPHLKALSAVNKKMKKMKGGNLYEDTKRFFGDVRRAGESAYKTQKDAREAFIDMKEHAAKGNDVSKAISGGMSAVEDGAKDLLFGGRMGYRRHK